MQDKASATDYVEAGLSSVAVAPQHGCPTCGKAMKDANTEDSREAGQDLRICSNRACRAKADWASGFAVLLEV